MRIIRIQSIGSIIIRTKAFILNSIKRRRKIMKIQLYSKTTAGKWAANLTLLFIGLMAIKLSALAMFIRLPLPTPFLALIGVVGFVLGIISIVKNKDRAIFTLLAIPIGLLIIFWTVAEIIFPH